jgi:2'-5' RNA ligase
VKSIYDDMWRSSTDAFLQGRCEPDLLIDQPVDRRRGLTVIIRPPEQVLQKLARFLAAANEIESGQYFYAPSEIHTTVLSVFGCSESFDVDQIDPHRYAGVVEDCMGGSGAFQLHYRGITASPSCILIQGFPSGPVLNDARDALRSAFAESGLRHAFDTRYPISTAHSTVIRFREPLALPRQFVDFLEVFRETDFGYMDVREIHLVSNDWYHRENLVQELGLIRL